MCASSDCVRILRLPRLLSGIEVAFALAILAITVACGSSGSGTITTTAQRPLISTQPSSQSTRVGQQATFSVTASGTPPLSYQWSKNGTAIAEATGFAYTTPAAVPSDNGATYAVAVSNSAGSAISSAAALTVGPRAPKSGDWRFQGIDLPGSGALSSVFNILVPQTETYPNQIGTPLQIGAAPGLCYPGINYDCSWAIMTLKAPTGVSGLTTSYQTDVYASLESDLDALNSPGIVITGLDLEAANQCFAVSTLQTSQPSGLVFTRQWVPASELQGLASYLGQQSQVITALSFNAGQVYVFSYGWQNDTTTAYEASVVSATGDTVVTQAANLASQGYIITAMGGDPTDGLLLVGTRVAGDTMARPFDYETPSGIQGTLPSGVQTLSREIFNSGANYEMWINEQ